MHAADVGGTVPFAGHPAMTRPHHYADGHLDLAYIALNGRDLTRPLDADDPGCISLPALRDADVNLVCATIFTEPVDPDTAQTSRDPAVYPAGDADAACAAGRRQLVYYESLADAGEVSIVHCAGDLDGPSPLPRLILLMEGADPICSPDHVAWWADRGLRMVGLTWSMGTRYAGGNSRPGSLTAEGRDLVRAIDRHGLAHDVSHLADEGIEALLDLATGPVAASHSNNRMCFSGDDAPGSGNQRHLLDRHICAIAERGGIVGLNLFARFISDAPSVDARDAIRHVEHIVEITGQRDCVGIGSDMDGGFDADQLPVDVNAPAKFGRLADVLSDAGWSDDAIEGFAWRNWHRFLTRVLNGGS